METFSALLTICAGNSTVTGEFPSQMPVTRSFDVFFDLSPNKRWSKQSWGWWFETSTRSLWRHCNVRICCAWYIESTMYCECIEIQPIITYVASVMGNYCTWCSCIQCPRHDRYVMRSGYPTHLMLANYSQISNISCIKSQNWNVSRLVLQLTLSNPLKSGIESRMEM